MEPNQQQPQEVNTNSPTHPETESKVGPIIGVIVIILVLLLGVLYFWGQRVDRATQDTVADIDATSEDLTSLESDLNAELTDLEAELDTEFSTF